MYKAYSLAWSSTARLVVTIPISGVLLLLPPEGREDRKVLVKSPGSDGFIEDDDDDDKVASPSLRVLPDVDAVAEDPLSLRALDNVEDEEEELDLVGGDKLKGLSSVDRFNLILLVVPVTGVDAGPVDAGGFEDEDSVTGDSKDETIASVLAGGGIAIASALAAAS